MTTTTKRDAWLKKVTQIVSSIPGLVTAVLAIETTSAGPIWYRGIPCEHHQLLPKLLRDGKDAEDVFERETRLLTRFRQRSLPFWPAGYPQDNWEQLFAMQHYGLPTRLLDWSESLLVAMYFALNSNHKDKHDGPCRPVVWCIDPVGWNRAMPALSEYGDGIHILATSDDEAAPYAPATERKRQKSPVAIHGTHNSQRIVAQRGTFMVWGNDPRPLEDFAADVEQPCISRIVVDGDREGHRAALLKLGVSETMVYPELVSLAGEIERTEAWR